MVNFDYQNPTRVVFGRGTIPQVGALLKEYAASKVLLHFGGGSIKANGVYDAVKKSLDAAGIGAVELGGVKPNPRLSLVKEGIKLCRDQKIDFILAVGGGSVIDSAKAVSAGVPYEGDVWDFYTGKALPQKALPVATVLTIAAAGSETSWSSVITNDDGGWKRPLDHQAIYPVFSILDPETTYSLPAYQTACGITDMFVHVFERYFTTVKNVELTDRFCEAVMKTIINNAQRLLENPKDYDARAEIMWCGSLAHNNLAGTGRIGDFASHMIEHELSAFNDVAHGAGLAVIVPNWMKYVYKHDIPRFVQFAVRVFGVEENFHNPEEMALRGIRALRDFYTSLGMPGTLSEIGIAEKDFPAIAGKIRKFDEAKGTTGNFLPLTSKDVLEILKLAK
ncbi:MAG: iron-containing alcohol dehydrogenase [Treponema sp.]|jgi:alcohol dehydrogenase YqhD (iron-dependent ADH family)|nr:iron-containing alcohol dehydrogenase [Treponema sp.]